MNLNTRVWSTPLVIGAGIFVAASGTLMFWRLAGPLETAHEWLGLAFAVGILLHVLNHWRSFQKYFQVKKNAKGLTVLAICLATALYFVGMDVFAEDEGGARPSPRVMAQSLAQADLATIARLRGTTADELTERLVSAGVEVMASDMSVRDIAREAPFYPSGR